MTQYNDLFIFLIFLAILHTYMYLHDLYVYKKNIDNFNRIYHLCYNKEKNYEQNSI